MQEIKTAQEVADIVGVTYSTIRNWIKNNNMPYQKIAGVICFDKSQVDFILKNKEKFYHAKPKNYKAIGWYDRHREKKNDKKTS